MAQRQTTRRIETVELQGDGSFVVLKRIPYKQAKQAIKYLADKGMVQTEEKVAEEVTFTEELIMSSIVDWNWADEKGEPLPIPKTADDLDLLTWDEVTFLITEITGMNNEKSKN